MGVCLPLAPEYVAAARPGGLLWDAWRPWRWRSGDTLLVQEMDVFLRDFIGYQENQITNLDIEWETDDGLAAVSPLRGSPILVFQAPDGSSRSKPLTGDALQRFRDAMLADIQKLGSGFTHLVPQQRRHRRRVRASRTR